LVDAAAVAEATHSRCLAVQQFALRRWSIAAPQASREDAPGAFQLPDFDARADAKADAKADVQLEHATAFACAQLPDLAPRKSR
jgi:hypothetical protein